MENERRHSLLFNIMARRALKRTSAGLRPSIRLEESLQKRRGPKTNIQK